jgi:hypothetical protein
VGMIATTFERTFTTKLFQNVLSTVWNNVRIAVCVGII